MFDSKLLTALCLFATVVLLLAACGLLGSAGLVVPLTAAGGVLLAARPKWALAAFWLTTLCVPSAEIVLPPVLVKFVEQTAGLYILGLLVAGETIRRSPIPGTRLVVWVLVPLAVLATISAAANRVPARSLVFYVLTYAKHWWVFLYGVRYLKESDSRFVFRVFLLSAAVQLPLNAAAYLGFNPLPDLLGRGFQDKSIGTLSSSHHVGYYMAAAVLLLVACMQHARSLTRRLAAGLGVLLAAAQFVFTFTMHAYPPLFAALGLQYAMSSRRALWRVLRLTGFAVLCLAGLLVLRSQLPARSAAAEIVSSRVWQERWNAMRRGPKGDSHYHVLFRAGDHLPFPLLGGGPGNYTSNVALLTGRPLALQPHMSYPYMAVDWRSVTMGGSILAVPRTGMLSLWGELGPLGLLLFWGLYVYAPVRVWRLYKAGRYRDPYQRVLAHAFVPVMFMFIGLNVLIEVLIHAHLNCGLWLWAAAVWNPPPAKAAAGRCAVDTTTPSPPAPRPVPPRMSVPPT